MMDEPVNIEPSLPNNEPSLRSRAGLGGAAAAGLALGLTEFSSGLFSRVPSAISSVGSFVVDSSPGFVKRFAVDVFGTADKGALAIGTVVIGVLAGYLAGRASVRRPWIAALAFGLFGLAGIAAGLDQPLSNAPGTVIVVAVSALAGWMLLRAILGLLAAREPETPTDGLPADPGRRRFAAVVAGAGAAGLVGGVAGRKMIIDRSERVREATGLPLPRTQVAAPGAENSFAVDGLESIVVPNDEFYRIDTALVVPRPDVESWRLRITGMVDREVEFSHDELLAMDLHERYVTISCVSNEVGGGLVGNAKWTGVRLVDLLDRAGVKPEATQIVGRSVDGWTAGFPTDVALDGRDPLLAVGMNGVPLPARHGFPARLIVPGLYGYVSATKWIEEIELTRWEDFDAYWVPRGWSKLGPIKTQSRIDTPDGRKVIPGNPAVLAGVAWAPLKGIDRVEVRVDEGEWHEAELSSPLSDASWVQWKLELPVAVGDHTADVRATDGDGMTQGEARVRPDPNGAEGWHRVRFEVV
jgi:DMSO/TMAO reductase YedYZ molybdopterin-dependent catalytic subunit